MSDSISIYDLCIFALIFISIRVLVFIVVLIHMCACIYRYMSYWLNCHAVLVLVILFFLLFIHICVWLCFYAYFFVYLHIPLYWNVNLRLYLHFIDVNIYAYIVVTPVPYV